MSLYQEYKSSLKITAGEEIFDLLIYRPLAFILVKGISSTSVTPNQVTFAGILSFLAAGIFISKGAVNAVLAAGLFIGVGNILDCADGQLARVNQSGTEFGRILDGLADYISTIALFVGIGLWGESLLFDPLTWWGLVIVASISYGWQASLVDYYRNEFFSCYEDKDNFVSDEIKKSKDKLQKLRNDKGNRIHRFILSSYILYSTIQLKMQPRQVRIEKNLSKQYVKSNLSILRLWCLNGTSTPKTIAIICCLFNRLDIFLVFVLVIGTIWSLVLLILQKRTDKKLLMSAI
jgi:hypothetical protein